jgi:hypothetical protein
MCNLSELGNYTAEVKPEAMKPGRRHLLPDSMVSGLIMFGRSEA